MTTVSRTNSVPGTHAFSDVESAELFAVQGGAYNVSGGELAAAVGTFTFLYASGFAGLAIGGYATWAYLTTV